MYILMGKKFSKGNSQLGRLAVFVTRGMAMHRISEL